ncbi:hypothetical protein MF271_23875 (plasmid) [Deinococcus sp. KNUC1210]|uniref:hypothetical protein n=1 Tax=Deinococcus sp. KNUC1210 TaxID=2917691 RepID=UPI001EEFEEA8|nr:hypothetical protein [Deinococcus sp. KNUC1210]ULH18003.1 hypothetical protein MF271_23875 [Deinococcus sp. KNUC1210]
MKYDQLRQRAQQLPETTRTLALTRLDILYQRTTPVRALTGKKPKKSKTRTKYTRRQKLAIKELTKLLQALDEQLEHWANAVLRRHLQEQQHRQDAQLKRRTHHNPSPARKNAMPAGLNPPHRPERVLPRGCITVLCQRPVAPRYPSS